MSRWPLTVLLAGLIGLGPGAQSSEAQQFDLDRELSPSATAGCVADVSPPAPNTRAPADATKVLPPQQGIYLGTYQIPTNANEIARFANATGRMPPIVFTFHDLFADTNRGRSPDRGFGDIMEGGNGAQRPLELAAWMNERGSVLAVAWAIYCCDISKTRFWFRLLKPHDHFNRILRGEHDDFFRQQARMIRDFGRPIMLTIVPEMNWQGQFLFGADGRRWMDAVDNICNQYGDPRWPDGPERIRDVFIRVIDIFRQEGVKNVTWFMYSSNDYMRPNVEGQSRWFHPKYYYPGDAYIDWVGQSAYYTASNWRASFDEAAGTFEEVLAPGYNAWRSVTRRPLLLAEFGLLANRGADRSLLWQNLLQNQLKQVPGVKAVTVADSVLFEEYFNVPRLSTNAQEVGVVKGITDQDSYFRNGLRLGRQ